MNTQNLKSLVVVGNSKHHSLSILSLLSQINRDEQVYQVVCLCPEADLNFFKSQERFHFKTVGITKNGHLVFEQQETKNENLKTAQRLSSSHNRQGIFISLVSILVKLHFNLERLKPYKMISHLLIETSLVIYLREKKAFSYFYNVKVSTKKYLAELRPVAVLSFGDRHPDIEASIFIAAKELGIKIVIPYVAYSSANILVSMRKHLGEPKIYWPFSFYRLYLKFKYPKQLREGFFCFHPAITRALDRLGAISSNPWIVGNGLSDVVFVDNLHTQTRYEAEGVSKEKIKIVGDISYDSLRECFENKDKEKLELISEFALDAQKPLLIFALPQFYEQGIFDEDKHWSEIYKLLDTVIKSEANVILSLHPRCDLNQYKKLEQKYNVNISKKPLKEILPCADVFVAINSSTVFWSPLCGIPALVLDFYGLGESMFSHLTNVKLIKNLDELHPQIEKSINLKNVDFKSDWHFLSRNEVFDGKVLKRYQEYI